MTTAQLLLSLAIPLAVMLGLAVVGYENWKPSEQFSLASETARIVELTPCTDEATRERVRGLMSSALDEALRTHIEDLFKVMLKDDTGQPERARHGVQRGLKAYLRAQKGVEDWSPTLCQGQ